MSHLLLGIRRLFQCSRCDLMSQDMILKPFRLVSHVASLLMGSRRLLGSLAGNLLRLLARHFRCLRSLSGFR